MTKKQKPAPVTQSNLERAALWVGSVCGIVVALFTIYDRVSQPSPPDLRVAFFESASDTLRLYPPSSTSIEKTEPIPLQVRVENLGGTAAKNVKIYISHDESNAITTSYKAEEKRTWNEPNQGMKQLQLSVQDINPAESLLIPTTFELDFPRDFQRAIRAHPSDVRDKRELVPRRYPIYVDISSDTSPNRRTTLSIVLGNFEILKQESADLYWVGHGDKGPKVLKAKDDFLSAH